MILKRNTYCNFWIVIFKLGIKLIRHNSRFCAELHGNFMAMLLHLKQRGLGQRRRIGFLLYWSLSLSPRCHYWNYFRGTAIPTAVARAGLFPVCFPVFSGLLLSRKPKSSMIIVHCVKYEGSLDISDAWGMGFIKCIFTVCLASNS